MRHDVFIVRQQTGNILEDAALAALSENVARSPGVRKDHNVRAVVAQDEHLKRILVSGGRRKLPLDLHIQLFLDALQPLLSTGLDRIKVRHDLDRDRLFCGCCILCRLLAAVLHGIRVVRRRLFGFIRGLRRRLCAARKECGKHQDRQKKRNTLFPVFHLFPPTICLFMMGFPQIIPETVSLLRRQP